jgi:hypothetical protein
MRIGIDFDNTIARYDAIFARLGRQFHWLPDDFAGTKLQSRDLVRGGVDGEQRWQTLQALAYGPHMAEAELFDGVIDFLGRCRQGGHKVAIVSHKTQFAARDRGEVDLRQAALDWMQGQGFFSPAGLAIERHQVIFADSRRQKCQTIGALRCDLFIDDLPELFADSAFPADTRRILFHDAPPPIPCGRFEALGSWKEIADAIFRQS